MLISVSSKPVLHRCIPKPIKEVTESILRNFYDILNGWDTLEQILGDLYHTWKEILGLAVLALCKYRLTVSHLDCRHFYTYSNIPVNNHYITLSGTHHIILYYDWICHC